MIPPARFLRSAGQDSRKRCAHGALQAMTDAGTAGTRVFLIDAFPTIVVSELVMGPQASEDIGKE